jgi:hypothetical protein
MTKLMVILRGMARTPVFSGIAILSLALGIGANTAMFSLLDQFLLRTLPVKNPQELVFLYHPGPAQGSVSSDEKDDGPSFSYPMFREMQKEQTPFAGLAGSQLRRAPALLSTIMPCPAPRTWFRVTILSCSVSNPPWDVCSPKTTIAMTARRPSRRSAQLQLLDLAFRSRRFRAEPDHHRQRLSR